MFEEFVELIPNKSQLKVMFSSLFSEFKIISKILFSEIFGKFCPYN